MMKQQLLQIKKIVFSWPELFTWLCKFIWCWCCLILTLWNVFFVSVQRNRFDFMTIFTWYAGHKGEYRTLNIRDPVSIDVDHLSPWQHAVQIPVDLWRQSSVFSFCCHGWCNLSSDDMSLRCVRISSATSKRDKYSRTTPHFVILT